MNNPFKREYWYVAFLHNERPVVWRLENVHSEPEAARKGAEKLSGRFFKVFSMTTKDENEATKHAKALLLDETGNVDGVLKRAKHTDIDMQNEGNEDNRSL